MDALLTRELQRLQKTGSLGDRHWRKRRVHQLCRGGSAREIFGSLEGKKIMIVGAGKMSESAARHLRRQRRWTDPGHQHQHQRALEMVELFDGQLVDYTRSSRRFPKWISSFHPSAAPHYVILRDDMERSSRPAATSPCS